MLTPNKLKIAGALALTALLAACGGGGGGSAPATTSTSTGSTAPTSTNTGTTTTTQYPAGSQQLAALNQINAMHQQCGFAEFAENTLLDQAAANHMAYMADQKTIAHIETVTSDPHYTGSTPTDRARYVGYAGSVGEVITSRSNDIGGANSVMALASVPYHLTGLFYPMAEIGISYEALNFGPSNPAYTLLMDMATSSSGTPAAPTYSNAPLTFPCQGTTGVGYESSGTESPAPYVNGQAVDTGANPIGTPITVIGNVSDTVRLTSGVVMAPGGAQTTLNVYDSSNDPNNTLLANTAIAFPTSPLQPSTTYSVILNGTVNGAAFSRNFSFTTGAQGQF